MREVRGRMARRRREEGREGEPESGSAGSSAWQPTWKEPRQSSSVCKEE